MLQHPIPAPTAGQDAKRRCHVCRAFQPLSEFVFNSKRGLYASRCKACNAAYMKRYYRQNKAAHSANRRARQAEINASKRQRYQNDPEYRREAIEKSKDYRRRFPSKKWEAHLRSTYGLTSDQYAALLESQGGGCAICGRTDCGDKRPLKLHVDHDHVTGKVRGILCSKCNRAIGLFDDNPDAMANAVAYLRRAANASL